MYSMFVQIVDQMKNHKIIYFSARSLGFILTDTSTAHDV